jgi:uncharacterized protein YbaR (Trm112 family)
MHILLTDILTCPVCGPEHGLILRSDRIADRRVQEGALGCPNCSRQFPIDLGIADLREPGAAGEEAAVEASSSTKAGGVDGGIDSSTGGAGGEAGASGGVRGGDEAALRIAALLGLDQGNGFAMLLGPDAALAGLVAQKAPGYEIIADADHAASAHGVSRIRAGATIPIYAGRLRGLWLSGARTTSNLGSAAHALHPLGRLVLEPAPSNVEEAIAATGMRIIARQEQTVLAART